MTGSRDGGRRSEILGADVHGKQRWAWRRGPEVAVSLDEMGRRRRFVDPLVRCFPPPISNMTTG